MTDNLLEAFVSGMQDSVAPGTSMIILLKNPKGFNHFFIGDANEICTALGMMEASNAILRMKLLTQWQNQKAKEDKVDPSPDYWTDYCTDVFFCQGITETLQLSRLPHGEVQWRIKEGASLAQDEWVTLPCPVDAATGTFQVSGMLPGKRIVVRYYPREENDLNRQQNRANLAKAMWEKP
jgi:hypothetical protein